MDDDGGLGHRNWVYYEQPLKGSLRLQLMSPVAERDTKNLLSNGGFFHRDCSAPERSVPPAEIERDGWIYHRRDREEKMLHMPPVNHFLHHHHPHFISLPDPSTAQTVRAVPEPEPPENNKFQMMDAAVGNDESPLKKRALGRPKKSPKPKKQKKVAKSRDVTAGNSVSVAKSRKSRRESEEMIVNGVSLDISGIPTPVCSCTGKPQQCYRWGAGGWQSACCTTSMSVYPLPMSTKRRGARIAGRKMSQGAFRKVLEKLTEEGQNLSDPIDLKVFWAKHGTNKFVTIR